jgi:putative transposase
MPDHVHMMISIPPKYAVSQVIGYIKGKALSIWPIRKQEAEDSRLDQLNMWR